MRSSRTSDYSTNLTLTLTRPRKSRPLSLALRQRLLLHLRDSQAQHEHDYDAYTMAVREVLPDKENDPDFMFVVRCLWLESMGWPESEQTKELASRYRAFVEEFPWGPPLGAHPHPDERIKHTLAVWQKHSPLRLSTSNAIEILDNVRSAVKAVKL